MLEKQVKTMRNNPKEPVKEPIPDSIVSIHIHVWRLVRWVGARLNFWWLLGLAYVVMVWITMSVSYRSDLAYCETLRLPEWSPSFKGETKPFNYQGTYDHCMRWVGGPGVISKGMIWPLYWFYRSATLVGEIGETK